MTAKREYAILYLRPDGWWLAGQGWDNYYDCLADCKKYSELYEGFQHRIVIVGKGPWRKAMDREVQR